MQKVKTDLTPSHLSTFMNEGGQLRGRKLTSFTAMALRGRPRLFSAAAAAPSTRSACCKSCLLYQDRKKCPYSEFQLPPSLTKKPVSHAAEL